MRLFHSKFSILFIAFIFSFSCANKIAAQDKDAAWYISNAPFKMPEVILPIFPGKQFLITDFGAIGNGQTLNTEAFSKTNSEHLISAEFKMIPIGK